VNLSINCKSSAEDSRPARNRVERAVLVVARIMSGASFVTSAVAIAARESASVPAMIL